MNIFVVLFKFSYNSFNKAAATLLKEKYLSNNYFIKIIYIMASAGIYKKCIFISIIFILIGLTVLLFGAIFLPKMIEHEVLESAKMKEETYDLWGEIPGKTNVELLKKHYFYNIENLEGLFYNNENANATEAGPYVVQEFDDYANRTYSSDNKTVTYKMFRYYKDKEGGDAQSQEDYITSLNVVGLGVWYQAKNAPRSQVALKALYTIYHSLVPDLYYGYIQTATKQTSVDRLDFVSKLDYLSDDLKNKMADDPDYGLYQYIPIFNF